jgi:predicted transcriptional regulator
MDNTEVAVRSFVCKAESKPSIAIKSNKKARKPFSSYWTLAFDAETTIDASQKLRFGTYQVRKDKKLHESGVFYAPDVLTKSEQKTLFSYAEKQGLKILTVAEFIEEIFYGIGYQLRATIVGLNLPFDISRLAIDHNTARTTSFSKLMQNGYSLKLSEKPFYPRVQIKHVSSKNSFIRFAATMGQRNTRGDRKKGKYQPVKRGFFVDIRTLAAALTSQSHSLDSLAKALKVESQKHETEEHGKTLTENYIEYAVQDTQATWECYVKLKELYKSHNLKQTPSHKIHSEASLGKAYLLAMGVQPWRKLQPDFPNEILGIIMSTYYGGRSEVHIRREPVQVLYCDFLSMYPTVCTFMGLWKFVTAQGVTWKDSTNETKDFLEKVTVNDLQNPRTWGKLHTLVQVKPNKDIFPVRAKYSEKAQYTIGSNYLTSDKPLWFTLADCIASKLLTGKAPEILQSIYFTPKEVQENLSTINIAGNKNYKVNPYESDFFKRVIDLRREVKGGIKTALEEEKELLENQQLALKILANSTSYGIFVEFNVEEEKNLQSLLCYGENGEATQISKKKFEATGSFFHPLLATLITGAARLMLATSELLATDTGLDWAFCDTDSMALAKPENMQQDEFFKRAKQVYEWFTPLSPYEGKPALFKIEDENYNFSDKNKIEPLFCHAVSSKRYALFNFDKNRNPILRKVSSHGLGHLLPPYQKNSNGYLKGVPSWHQDLWLEIINAELQNKQPNYSKLENFNNPAVSRYAATTPALLKWFNKYNENKPYKDSIKPFNFMLAMQAKQTLLNPPKPVAPYNKNLGKAQCFDRETGKKVSKTKLRTYQESIAQYHLHPETKFLNGDFLDKGKTQRHHVVVNIIQHIGKEANKWEEQHFLGTNPEEQLEYGITPEQKEEQLKTVLKAIKIYGTKPMADIAKISARQIQNIKTGKTTPKETTIQKLYFAAKTLEKLAIEEQELCNQIKLTIKEKNITITKLSKKLNIDASNLSKMLSSGRKLPSDINKNLKKFTSKFPTL